MTQFIQRIDRRLIALVAVLAIAASGLASMAALTGTLTVTSTFAGAQILISGNGQTGSATLFATDQVVAPGETVAAPLEIKNVGNVAAHFTYTPPIAINGAGNLKDQMLVRVYNPTAWSLANQTDAQRAATCSDLTLVGWEPQMAEGLWTTINISSFDLNADQSRWLCYTTRLPSGITLDENTDMSAVQSFLGTEN